MFAMHSLRWQIRWLFLTTLMAVSFEYPLYDDVRNMMFDMGYIDLSQYGSRIFGYPDNSTGQRLAQYDSEENDQNPEELGSYLEGDILMPLGQARNGLTASGVRWPGGIIPYVIRGNFDDFQMQMFEDAFNEYHTKTCIKFKPRTDEQDYIVLMNGKSGCWSSVGRIGGRQDVNLQTPGCMRKIGTVIHELMHVCGFLHEHNREERDGFVTINWNNVKNGLENNFQKARSSSTSAFGVKYDYGSVMHYSATAFSKNGRPTISAKFDGPAFGQRDGFSEGDVAKLNSMYRCNSETTETSSTGSEFTFPENEFRDKTFRDNPFRENPFRDYPFRDNPFRDYSTSYDEYRTPARTSAARFDVNRYYQKRYKSRSRDDDEFVRLIL